MNNKAARYMLFSTGGQRYAVAVDDVDEIAELLPEYPIPDAPRFLRGVVNIHGKIAAVLDLSMYLGTGPVKNGRNLLLLKMPGTGLAILVEQMERMIMESEILASLPRGAEFEIARFTLPEGSATLLATAALVESIETAVIS